MVWLYVAAVQGTSQGNAECQLKSMNLYDISRREALKLGKDTLEKDGWLTVIADDVFEIQDVRGEDMGR